MATSGFTKTSTHLIRIPSFPIDFKISASVDAVIWK